MDKIYSLVHVYVLPSGELEKKELGDYSSRLSAEAAINRYRNLEGFKDYPLECFNILELIMDKDSEWTKGF